LKTGTQMVISFFFSGMLLTDQRILRA